MYTEQFHNWCFNKNVLFQILFIPHFGNNFSEFIMRYHILEINSQVNNGSNIHFLCRKIWNKIIPFSLSWFIIKIFKIEVIKFQWKKMVLLNFRSLRKSFHLKWKLKPTKWVFLRLSVLLSMFDIYSIMFSSFWTIMKLLLSSIEFTSPSCVIIQISYNFFVRFILAVGLFGLFLLFTWIVLRRIVCWQKWSAWTCMHYTS